MGRKGTTKPAELVTRLVDLGTTTLTEQCGLGEPQAREAMRQIAHNLCSNYGGQFFYMPKDREMSLTQRDMDIYNGLQSGNANELALKHRLSVQQVYAINRYVRDKLARERQNRLPGFDEPMPT